MPPLVLNVRAGDESRDVVHRAVQALAEGRLVAFPTETVYSLAASALQPEAVARLLEVTRRPDDRPLTLAVKSIDEALDYVPDMPRMGNRLGRRCWPGPMTLMVQDGQPVSLIQRLSDSVQKAVCIGGTIALRVPGHPVVLDVLRMLRGPLVLTSACRYGGVEPVTAAEVLSALGDDVQLVLDDGRSRFAQPATVVRISPNDQIDVVRRGVVSEQALKRLSSMMILFVCTGNTCRSPMAEAIARKLLAARLGCDPSQLEDRGVIVMSAGIAAMTGSRASPEAVEVLGGLGMNLAEHFSQPVTEQLVRQADHILAMTRSHRAAMLAEWPLAASRMRLVSADGRDISDPIGGDAEQYRRCANQIEQALSEWVAELDLGPLEKAK